MIREQEVYRIGKIGKPHGINGELTFYFEDDVFDRVETEYLVLDIEGILVPFFMEEYRFRSEETALVKFCDVDTQEEARRLTGCSVFFPRALTPRESDSCSYCELIGFEVVDDASGALIGKLTMIDDSTLNTLFEVQPLQGDTLLLPAPDEFIKEVDVAKRVLRLYVPDGILNM